MGCGMGRVESGLPLSARPCTCCGESSSRLTPIRFINFSSESRMPLKYCCGSTWSPYLSTSCFCSRGGFSSSVCSGETFSAAPRNRVRLRSSSGYNRSRCVRIEEGETPMDVANQPLRGAVLTLFLKFCPLKLAADSTYAHIIPHTSSQLVGWA